MATTLTLKALQISEITYVPQGSRITSTGNGNIEWTAGSLTDARNAPKWAKWGKAGAAGYMDTVRPMSIRATATGNMTVTIQEGGGDKYDKNAYFEEDMPYLSTDSAGSITGLTGLSDGLTYGIAKKYTWATRPSALAYSGGRIFISDVGVNGGAYFYSDGTAWLPVSNTVIFAEYKNRYTTSIAETVLSQYRMPAGLMVPEKTRIELLRVCEKSSTVETATTYVRVGTTGTIADATLNNSFSGNNDLATTIVRAGVNEMLLVTSPTTLRHMASYRALGGTGSNRIADATIPNVSNSLYWSFTGKLSVGAETLTQMGIVLKIGGI